MSPAVKYLKYYSGKVTSCSYSGLVIIIVQNVFPVLFTNPNFHRPQGSTQTLPSARYLPQLPRTSLSLNIVICFYSYFSNLIGRSPGQKTCCVVCWLVGGVFFLLLRISHSIYYNAEHGISTLLNICLNQQKILTQKRPLVCHYSG